MKLRLIFALVTLCGCAGNQAVERDLVSNAKDCAALGNLAAQATVISYAYGVNADWRMVGLIMNEPLSNQGLELEERKAFIQEIVETRVTGKREYDTLSSAYYVEEKCKAEQSGKKMLSFKVAAKDLEKCWHESIEDTQQCFNSVIVN